MQQGRPQGSPIFTCNACGHQFPAAWDVISKQPTCPNCRTFGQIIGPDGNPISGRQNVVRVQHPGGSGGRAPAGGRPAYAPQGGPVNYGTQGEDDFVEVRADVAYGKRTNTKAIINGVILLVLGIGMVTTLYFIVTTFKGDRAEEQRKEKEEVKDPKQFEAAIDKSQKNARAALERLRYLPGPAGVPAEERKLDERFELQTTTNFDEALDAIAGAGGTRLNWSAPPQPGKPFRAHGYLVRATDARTGLPVTGFLMMLYYKTAEEVHAARSEIGRYITTDMTHYGIMTNVPAWYVAYMGVSHGGELRDALKLAMENGKPITKQFTDRVGGTLRDELKD